jgi:hypothetical protein
MLFKISFLRKESPPGEILLYVKNREEKYMIGN